ncbi:MAG: hypothetical protein SGPRY_002450 [Prymnesium sp.]
MESSLLLKASASASCARARAKAAASCASCAARQLTSSALAEISESWAHPHAPQSSGLAGRLRASPREGEGVVQLARGAYEDSPPPGVEVIAEEHRANLRAIGTSSPVLQIAFRGSIIRSAHPSLKQGRRGEEGAARVHKGFQRAYLSLRPMLLEWLQARILAHECTARFVNSSDPVVRMPPHLQSRPWSFHHICAPTLLDGGAKEGEGEVDNVLLDAAEAAREEEEEEEEEEEYEDTEGAEEGGERRKGGRWRRKIGAIRMLPQQAHTAHKMSTYTANLIGCSENELL